jgi:hypothetical protein
MSDLNQSLTGRDRDYQSLNSNFAVNVLKFAMIISVFPKPLKPYVVMSWLEFTSLN